MQDLDPKYWPSWKYHKDFPNGKLFYHPDDVPKGWKDNPGKVGVEPYNVGKSDTTPDPDPPLVAEPAKLGETPTIIDRLAIKSPSAPGFLKKIQLISAIKAHGGVVRLGMKRPELVEELKKLVK